MQFVKSEWSGIIPKFVYFTDAVLDIKYKVKIKSSVIISLCVLNTKLVMTYVIKLPENLLGKCTGKSKVIMASML